MTQKKMLDIVNRAYWRKIEETDALHNGERVKVYIFDNFPYKTKKIAVWNDSVIFTNNSGTIHISLHYENLSDNCQVNPNDGTICFVIRQGGNIDIKREN